MRLVLGAALVLGLAAAAHARDQPDACAKRSASIVVDTRRSRLWLCEDGRALKEYAVAAGRGGTGKSDEGDKKTPLGRYSLGRPRPSKSFGLFIPIDYPTAEQRKRGARGGSVGLHGPKRGFIWAGRMNTWFNWTRGCIAVGSDAAIREIADWIKSKQAPSIEIE